MGCEGRAGRTVLVLSVIALGGCGGSAIKPSNGAGGHGGATETGSGGASFSDAAADALPTCSGTCVIPFASSSEWAAYDDDPASNSAAQSLGNALPVCLNATSPANCPPGAVLYGFGNAWAVDLSTVPGALWIWGPGTTASGPADLKRFAFSRTFMLGATPSGTISVVADDLAEVRVNGNLVGSEGSVTGPTDFALKSFDLSAKLLPGTNTITVVAQNGPASFAGCPSACTYSMNPAGVIFGGALTYH
jgi:hypothetical protein